MYRQSTSIISASLRMVGMSLNLNGLAARIQKIRHRGSTSFPFISGDNFLGLVDFRFVTDPNNRSSLGRISHSKVFFCESSLLSDFLKYAKVVPPESVLIVGNGDQEYFDSKIFPKNFSTILLQNSFISDNKRIYTLPIGIENLRIGVNGIPNRFEFRSQRQNEDLKLLIGPFGQTSGERLLLDELNDIPGINVERRTDRVPAYKYPQILREATWVACPRGNGIDTHRVWESLYVGSRPIVIDNSWSRSLVDFGYPLLLIKDWSASSISRAIQNDVNQNFDPTCFPPLWMDYWENWLNTLRTS